MIELHLEPLIAPALWIALAIVSVLFVAWYARSRPVSLRSMRWAGIVTLTAIGLAIVLAILLNPTWIEPILPPAGKPVLTILVDRSASMAAPSGDGQRTRYQSAIKAAHEITDQAGDRFEIRVQAFDDALMPIEIDELEKSRPQGTMTNLAGALAAAVGDDRPQGQAIVLLSDGIHNVGAGGDALREAAREARVMAAPIYTLTEGGQTEIHDLAVQLRWPQELAFIGQTVPAIARIEHRGMRGASTEVILTLGDREIARQTAQLLSDEPVEVRFDIRQDIEGLHRYEVHAQPIPNEATPANNTAAFILRTVDQPLRVLLLEGKPYWDTKFLVRTLAGDPAIQLDSVVQLTEQRWLRRTLHIAPKSQPAATASAPARREDWAIITSAAEVITNRDSLKEYQIVVLGRDVEPFLGDEAVVRLRQWIARDGGALVCFRGSPVTQIDQRLAPLMPVRWAPATESRFHLQLTSQGKDVNWLTGATQDELLGQMPSLATAMQVEPARPLTSVLARTTAADGTAEHAAISYQPYGTGRVVVIEGAGMWRWAFLPPQEQARDDVYRGLWQSLLRWLASSTGLLPGQNLALRADKAIFHTLENCTATLMARNESKAELGFQIQLQLEGSSPATLKSFAASPLGDEPGMFQVAFGRLPEGRYRAVLLKDGTVDDSVTAAFDVQPFLGEQLELTARPDTMARIAEESGGAVIEANNPAAAIKNFEQHLNAGRSHRVQQIIAWDRWWILLSVFTVWGTAWALRRSGGLV